MNTLKGMSEINNYPYRYHRTMNRQYQPGRSYDQSADYPERGHYLRIKDYGKEPIAFNITEITKRNGNFRTAFWTGDHFQLTLMCIEVGGEIGLEMHPDVDQFLRIEQGEGLVKMGNHRNRLDYQEHVHDDYAIIIPAGTWHNLINTGKVPIKLYSIYAPPQHPWGTIHETKAEAEADERYQPY